MDMIGAIPHRITQGELHSVFQALIDVIRTGFLLLALGLVSDSSVPNAESGCMALCYSIAQSQS